MEEDGVWVIGPDTMIEILASMHDFGIAVDLRDSSVCACGLLLQCPLDTIAWRGLLIFGWSKRRIGWRLHRLYLREGLAPVDVLTRCIVHETGRPV